MLVAPIDGLLGTEQQTEYRTYWQGRGTVAICHQKLIKVDHSDKDTPTPSTKHVSLGGVDETTQSKDSNSS